MATIRVKSNERVALVGKTRSGKTYFARHLCAPLDRLVVFDSKGTLGGRDWNLSSHESTWRALKRGEAGRYRIVGDVGMDWRPWLRELWRMRPITLYIDELLAVVPRGHKAPTELDALYTRGGELGIGVWAGMQRPRWVPPFALSEAEWIFLFRVAKKSDRQAISEFGDDEEIMMQPIRDEHGFYIYRQGWRRPRYLPRYQANETDIARRVAV